MSDQLLTFSFQNANLRGALVQTELSFQDLSHQHGDQAEYPLFIRQLLGEMNVLVLLMASNLKLEGTMSLQIRGSGYLYSALTDVSLSEDPKITIRGIARRTEQAQPSSLDLRDWVGSNATLAITLQPTQGQPYQGLIPLNYPRLTQCIEDYYAKSEQIPTKFWTQMSATRCAAIMLQSMPGAEQIAINENSIDLDIGAMLTNTLKPGELTETDPQTLLHRLFHEHPVLLHSERNIEYYCACQSRMKDALISLGRAELESMALENPTIEMTCQMCGAVRSFHSTALIEELQQD